MNPMIYKNFKIPDNNSGLRKPFITPFQSLAAKTALLETKTANKFDEDKEINLQNAEKTLEKVKNPDNILTPVDNKIHNYDQTTEKVSEFRSMPKISEKEQENDFKINNNALNSTKPFKTPPVAQNPITADKKYDEMYYEVIYTHRKRKKTLSDDGILILTIKKFILIDSKGAQVAQSPNMLKIRSFRDGDKLTLGLKDIEIIKKIKRDDYLSGRIFIQDNVIPEIQPIIEPKPKEFIYPEGALIIDSENKVFIEPFLASKLRPHQVEGVQFMYDSVTGKRIPGYYGCILADSMGLGKTLQAITLLYTLLRKDAPYSSFAKKGIIVSPATLVDNWKDELAKWLGPVRLTPIICSGTGKQKKNLLKIFEKGPSSLLIISYDSFVKHSNVIGRLCQIIICDEGHLLKNCITQKNTCINALDCKRRILLTGTPLQNYLSEFYACVSLVNPGILGDAHTFNKIFADPILKAQEPNASAQVRELAWGRSEELWRVTEQFILRRTGSILESVLPPRNEYLIFCKCLPLQKNLYLSLLNSNLLSSALETGNSSNALALTSLLKKIVNHPDLLYNYKSKSKEIQVVLNHTMNIFPNKYMNNQDRVEFSTKMMIFDKIMEKSCECNEKVIVVSSFTKTLDILEQLCEYRQYAFVRLDGSTLTKSRMNIVNQFNSTAKPMVFLLSTKAGGCGLNLVGASRLILFDPDWNPSNDKQAMGRVWRDGQKKTVHIYRLFLSGTIEEKIYQRQTAKQNLSSTVVDAKKEVSKFTRQYLKEIFSISDGCTSFEQGDDLAEFQGSFLDSLQHLFDVAKKAENEWNDVKTEKLDFTEAQKEQIETLKPENQAASSKKIKK
jgi:DNA repair and recombination protein RAD54B